MRTNIVLMLFFLTAFIANAGDTIFNTPPNMRRWNPAYMQQKFSDDFNGTSLNQNIWCVEQCQSRGYQANNEGEPNNIEVSNGTLKLTARYSPGNIDNNCWENTHFTSNYTTAEIGSYADPYRFKYGSFEAKCFMPKGNHYYYAYWLWGPDGGGYPYDGTTSEIDIAEGCEWTYDGSHHNMKSTFHLWAQSGEITIPGDATTGYGTTYEGAWHIYKILWDPYEVIFYVDENEVWRRTRYYTGSDSKANDVGRSQIIPNVVYHDRAWFPNDKMVTIFQMHNTAYTNLADLPVSMQVDYVSVKQFFLAPEITLSTQTVCTSGTATMDVDPAATNITWQLSPSSLFTTSSGTGLTANITTSPTASGTGTITFTFSMPSGETFTASKSFLIGLSASITGSTTISVGGTGNWTAHTTCGTPPFSYEWYLSENNVTGSEIVGTENTLSLKSVQRLAKAIVSESVSSNPVSRQPITHTDYFLRLQVTDANNAYFLTPEYPVYAFGIVDLIPLYNPLKIEEGENAPATQITILPNPASSEATLEISSTSGQEPDADTEWQIEVYDAMQSLKIKSEKLKGMQYAFSTAGWREGIYVVRVKFGDEILTGRLVVNP